MQSFLITACIVFTVFIICADKKTNFDKALDRYKSCIEFNKPDICYGVYLKNEKLP